MEKRHCLDQLGRAVAFDFPPQRIISLVPSQTELLFDLGLSDRVVGITKFCIHPAEWFATKPKVGGTKKFDFEMIDKLQPDLILGNKEENYEEGINRLSEKYPLWMSDITNWESAMQMILEVGDLTGANRKANSWVDEIRDKFKNLKPFSQGRVIYFIWKNPWMAAGQNTFIHTMLSKTGLVNCIKEERYPEVSMEMIRELSPEVILLSSEPFPFQQKHREELQMALPDTKVILVDGEMFSWYGSRLLKAPDYFASISQLIES